MSPDKQYYALRFRSSDDLHRRGDIRYVTEEALYIGQTPECALQLAPHPDYADTCYAVIVRQPQDQGWQLIRQEAEAAIYVNGQPLALVRNLHHGDVLQFDRTVMRFTAEQGELPSVSYVQHRPSWFMRIAMMLFALVLAGVVTYIVLQQRSPQKIYSHEIASVYSIQADTLLVLDATTGDTLDCLLTDRPMIGTGFLTEDGIFVTARHCLEFWLGMEDELKPSPDDITSPIVQWAIRAEEDTTLRLVAPVTITAQDGKQQWRLCSTDFLIDRSHDGLYDLGDMRSAYLWRSVISRYEKNDCELGDVAVMRWPDGKGTIRLADPTQTVTADQAVCCFGYPQSESSQQATFTPLKGTVVHTPQQANDWFVCHLACQPGFSGGPVFAAAPGKQVVGLVSRSATNGTAIVPAARIRQLIDQLDK